LGNLRITAKAFRSLNLATKVFSPKLQKCCNRTQTPSKKGGNKVQKLMVNFCLLLDRKKTFKMKNIGHQIKTARKSTND